MVALIDLTGNNSIVNTDGFKSFASNELAKKNNITYDSNINIRDLYDISIHTKDKSTDDIDRFDELNRLILNYSKKVTRRVTKKEIVYKKDKYKSILSIVITKHEGLKIFTFKDISSFDIEKKFYEISKGNCKPLEMCTKIKNDEDLKYVSLIINEYLDKIL